MTSSSSEINPESFSLYSSFSRHIPVRRGSHSIEASSGDIEIETSESYQLDAVCEYGEIEVEGEEKGSKYAFSKESPKVFLILHTASGDIEVN